MASLSRLACLGVLLYSLNKVRMITSMEVGEGRMKDFSPLPSPANHQLQSTGLTFLTLLSLACSQTKTETYKEMKQPQGKERRWPVGHTPLAFLTPLIPSTLRLISF